MAEIARDLPDHEARVALRGQVAEALESYRAEVDELHFSGFAFIEAEVREDVEQDVTRFLFALPVLLALVFLITFRSFQVFFAVLAFEVMGIASLPVLVNLNGFTLNLYTGILLPLVAGLQLTFLTHLFASLRWWHRRGLVFKDALAVALFHVFKPAAIAALTTGIGLLSLLTCDVGLVREFGLLGAQAVGAAFLVTFLPVYLLSRFVLRGVAQHELDAVVGQGGVEDSWRDGPLDRLVQAAVRKRRWILGLTLLLVLGTIPAMGRLRTDLRAMEFLSPEGESRITMGLIDVEMGGMNLFELVIDSGEDGGIQDPATMRYLEKVENYGRELDGVSNVYGYAQLFAVMNQIWSHDAPGTRRVPEDAGLIKAMELVVSGEKFLFGDQIFDKERRRTTMFLRTRDMRASKYLALLKDFIGYAEEHAPAGVVLDGKAGIHSVLESDRRIVGSQTRSLAICGLVVFITLSILWRSLLTALIAVLVNLPALAVVLALHGYGGIPLNSVTVMVGAVVLGIAVDNCIHVLSFWNEERQRGLGVEEAVRRVIAKKIGAMTCTTAVLVGGLGFFLFSSFPPVSDFGGLALVALTVALIATVFLLPPMIVVMVRDKATSK
ncbi:MAG: putative RND superfamily exporter protein [Planctomycetota bacterium]